MAETLNKLGFVGFGAMLHRTAKRLRDASHAAIAFDLGHDGDAFDGFALVGGAAEALAPD